MPSSGSGEQKVLHWTFFHSLNEQLKYDLASLHAVTTLAVNTDNYTWKGQRKSLLLRTFPFPLCLLFPTLQENIQINRCRSAVLNLLWSSQKRKPTNMNGNIALWFQCCILDIWELRCWNSEWCVAYLKWYSITLLKNTLTDRAWSMLCVWLI